VKNHASGRMRENVEKNYLGNRKLIIEQLNKYRRVSLLWFKVNNYYRQVQQMARDMLTIGKGLHHNIICSFICKIRPKYIQER